MPMYYDILFDKDSIMIIGVGCDICQISRLKHNFEKTAERLLTDNEYKIFSGFQSERRKIEFLAGRFSAKEAVVKALDVPMLIKNIEILNDENGKPYCTLDGYKIHISISHEREYSCAYALCESAD